jgi:hypothetical protein
MPSTRKPDPGWGTAKQACEVAGVGSASTLRNWKRKGLISAIRVGGGAYLYNLAEVKAMVVAYPRDVDERISELVQDAPDFTAEQIGKIRLLLHAAPDQGGGDSDAP